MFLFNIVLSKMLFLSLLILYVFIQSGKDNFSPQYPNSLCKTPDKVTGGDQLVQCFSKCNDLLHNSILSRAWSEIQIASKIRLI